MNTTLLLQSIERFSQTDLNEHVDLDHSFQWLFGLKCIHSTSKLCGTLQIFPPLQSAVEFAGNFLFKSS